MWAVWAALCLALRLGAALETELGPAHPSEEARPSTGESNTASDGNTEPVGPTPPGPRLGGALLPGSHQWYLLGLRGNTSLVHQRLKDFLLYLRINVASLAGSEYEAVKVNSVSYTPSLLVNISFTGRHSVSGLQKLAEQEDSLFLLSYVPFHVTSLTSRAEVLVPRPVTGGLSTPREEEALLYLGVGAAVAFVLSAGLLVCVLLLLGGKVRGRDKEPLIGQSSSFSGSTTNRYADPPQTIYSENFSQDLAREKERLHQFTPLDESLCPITDTEVDFTPRYLREDDRSSWLSDGSVGATVDIHSEPGCNGALPSHGFRPALSTFSEDGSLTAGPDGEADRASQLSRSPFYWQIPDSPSPCTPSPQPPALTSQIQKRNGKTPPRPPSRTDSLNPNSKAKVARHQAVAPRVRRNSDLPSSARQPSCRPLSVPAPFHLACRHGSTMSVPCPSPSPGPGPAVTVYRADQLQIDQDVGSILNNLGINQQ